jgi:PEP-CTERM motif
MTTSTRSSRSFGAALVTAVLVWAVLPASAQALSLTPDPLLFDLSGQGAINVLKGTIDVIGFTTGVPSGATYAGSISPTDVTILFQASSDPASDLSIPNFYVTTVGATESGRGTIPGPNEDVSANGGATFDFPNGLDGGETTDIFFISFSSIAPGATINWEIVVIPIGQQTAVPEPGTALLVLSAVGFATAWRRRGAAGTCGSA